MKKQNNVRLSDEQRELAAKNVKIAYKIARRYYMEHDSIEDQQDILSASMFGLCDAARKFDQGGKFKFSTFAYRLCRWAVLDHLKNRSQIHVPKWLRSSGQTEHEYREFLARAESVKFLSISPALEPQAYSSGNERRLADHEWLETALPTLPGKQQDAIRAMLAGLAMRQIASRLSCTYENARTLICRATANLKKIANSDTELRRTA
jgi:RNA polymerase sigma factor (sigma-70 family)